MNILLVSACLLGINCKYNGGNNANKDIVELRSKFKLVPVCPEQLGGCATPRLAAEIQGGDGRDVLEGTAKVIRKNGIDVSSEFRKGAQEVLKIAELMNIDIAILKARSPSCGAGYIYDGTFSGKLKEGNGVTAEILKRNGIKVITEEEIDKLKCI
ncbi:MAG: hypothetical protein BWY74_02167 [Firmicutes bacterium ADurb.Bin419]|nr:MAG: hypothetical protein BWY74_02167 [Firmicutes bacterium ADurb.Bin419]